jgi:hypothetical protein
MLQMWNSIMIGVLFFTGIIKWFSGSAGGIFAVGYVVSQPAKASARVMAGMAALLEPVVNQQRSPATSRQTTRTVPCGVRMVPAGAFVAVKNQAGKSGGHGMKRAGRVNPGVRGEGRGI